MLERWWEGLVNGTERVGIPWVVNHRLRAVDDAPLGHDQPRPLGGHRHRRVEWFRYPHVTPLNPGTEHLSLLRQALAAAGVGGNLVMDAHVAALAMEYQAEVHSNDTDFGRFPGLRWRNPL